MDNQVESKWGSETALHYEDFCKSHSVYIDTSEKLVALSTDHNSFTPKKVIDLACGTGVTTKKILSQYRDLSLVCGIDNSTEMITYARADPELANVQFIQGSGNELANLLSTKIDLVVCNSALWLMNIPAVFRSLVEVLEFGGTFCFSMPGYLLQNALNHTLLGKKPWLMEQFIKAIADHESVNAFSYQTLINYNLTEEKLLKLANQIGLKLKFKQSVGHFESIASTYDSLKMPAILDKYRCGVEQHMAMKLLDELAEKNSLAETTQVNWIYYVLTN